MTTAKKLNGVQLKQHNYQKFIKWTEDVSDVDLISIVSKRSGLLKRVDVAKLADINRKNLTDNADIVKALEAFENKLRSREILPKVANDKNENASDKCKDLNANEFKDARASQQLAKAQQRILELESQLEALTDDLERLSEHSEVYLELAEYQRAKK
ncbi:hypothetical protein [Thalassotalea eurytherma]|uniref:Uncharacterized protein n=1 Tax=Thalassotalea eurytherma TaxID=1144278 RepID=A0ABQ6H2W2_9GAMM|nr:hypothetical protein [Thalassotalea eurytherma]GLX81859.1 hypothetical protein theurythT_13110 [Thalassotalea eurytherma]